VAGLNVSPAILKKSPQATPGPAGRVRAYLHLIEGIEARQSDPFRTAFLYARQNRNGSDESRIQKRVTLPT